MPPLAPVIARIFQEIANPRSDARSVSEIVSSDPTLVLTILKAINSSFYGREQEIRDVRQAISLLGFDTVQSLVMQFGLTRMFSSNQDELGYQTVDIWSHCLCVSMVSQVLSRNIAGVDPGFLSTFGLLHDIGKVAMNARWPGQVERLLHEPMRVEETFLERELRVMGIDHASLGQMVAETWGLPNEVQWAIGHHHDLEGARNDQDHESGVRKAIVVNSLSNQIAKMFGLACGDPTPEKLYPDSLESLGLPSSIIELLTPQVKQAVSRAVLFVNEIAHRSILDLPDLYQVDLEDRCTMPMEWGGEWVTSVRSRIGIGTHSLLDLLDSEASKEFDIEDLSDSDLDLGAARDVRVSGKATEISCLRLVRFLDRVGRTFGVEGELGIRMNYLVRRVLRGVLPRRGHAAPEFSVRFIRTEENLILVFESLRLEFDRHMDIAGTVRVHGIEGARDRCRDLLRHSIQVFLMLDWFTRLETDETGRTFALIW
jgi:putative nucleotidyltransferase with HDIG domain